MYIVRDGNGVPVNFLSIESGGAMAPKSVPSDEAGESYSRTNPIPTSMVISDVASSIMTRPADVIAYASGDLMGDSTTAASVTPLIFSNAVLAPGQCLSIKRVLVKKSGVSITTCTIRVNFYTSMPTGIVNGDNAAFSTAISGYVGYVDVIMDKAFSNGAFGAGPALTTVTLPAITIPGGTTLYALLEIRSAYTPASAETFQVIIEGFKY